MLGRDQSEGWRGTETNSQIVLFQECKVTLFKIKLLLSFYSSLYHKDCLVQWIHQNLTCPLCRSTDLLKSHIPSNIIECSHEKQFELKLEHIDIEEEEEKKEQDQKANHLQFDLSDPKVTYESKREKT